MNIGTAEISTQNRYCKISTQMKKLRKIYEALTGTSDKLLAISYCKQITCLNKEVHIW